LPDELPLLATRDEVILPRVVTPMEVGRPMSLRAIDAALAGGGEIVAVPQRHPALEEPGPADLHDIGVRCEISQVAKTGRSRYSVVLRAIDRVRVDEVIGGSKLLVARVSPLAVTPGDDEEVLEGLAETVRGHLRGVVFEQTDDPEGIGDVLATIEDIDDPDELVDVSAAHLDLSRDEAVALLLETDMARRLTQLIPELERLEQVLRIKSDIEGELEERVSAQMREKVLRARMRSIKEELGEADDDAEADELREKILAAEMPEEVAIVARKMLRRIETTQTGSQEHQIAHTYLEWLLDVPWSISTEDTLDVPAARAILEADHAGLEKIKKRILEFIAVRKLVPDMQSPILCLVGPPGVGKTSLGRSIATALGRKYVRISLGGVRDEAEIRGHRRTYVGALPGRIVSGLKKAGTRNPVFVLDEIDKMSSGLRGDPASAMLEVLDPEQNSEFVDHYLEVPVDLSRVMFIATANQLGAIPAALRDRMEVIQVPGYTENEKVIIATRHLIPRQIAEHGLERGQVEILEPAVREVVRHYTRESGVRNLERELASVCRDAAVRIAEDADKPVVIDAEAIAPILGPRKVFSEVAGTSPQIGVTTGLAWTPVGGEILFIEARRMSGTGKLEVTGQLGDVMAESVQAAYSYVRSKGRIDPEAQARSDIHLHLPGGAIRKDGPSAGVAIAVALTSLFSGKPVRPDVAITGEITLRGRVLEVGGIKEKVLAAHRAGIRVVCLPERNANDLIDIPAGVKDELDIRLVSHVDEVLEVALAEPEAGDLDDRHRLPPMPPELPPPPPTAAPEVPIE
jgi:ATP-dependent Lon protease